MKYTQDSLLREVQEVMAHSVGFNFLYLPWDARKDCNVGYCFINCCQPDDAERCRALFTDYFFRESARRKQCEVFSAHIQGLESNLLHLMGTAVVDSLKHYPAIFW